MTTELRLFCSCRGCIKVHATNTALCERPLCRLGPFSFLIASSNTVVHAQTPHCRRLGYTFAAMLLHSLTSRTISAYLTFCMPLRMQ